MGDETLVCVSWIIVTAVIVLIKGMGVVVGIGELSVGVGDCIVVGSMDATMVGDCGGWLVEPIHGIGVGRGFVELLVGDGLIVVPGVGGCVIVEPSDDSLVV